MAIATRSEDKFYEIFIPPFSLKVPHEFVTLVSLDDQTVPVVMTFPVRSDQGNHDAFSLLKGIDPRFEKIPANLHLMLDVDLCVRKTEFFRKVYETLRTEADFSGSRAEKFLQGQIDLSSQTKQLQFIREKAQFYNVAITQIATDEVPDIAVIANQKFGAVHRRAICNSIEYSATNLFFNALFTAPGFTTFDGIFLPATVIYVAYKNHTLPPDKCSFLKSMNHVSLPTIGLYGVTATAFYAGDYALASAAGTMAAAVLLPAALGGTAYVVYHYGWKCATAAADRCKKIPANVSELCGKVGMKLWGLCHRQKDELEIAGIEEERQRELRMNLI